MKGNSYKWRTVVDVLILQVPKSTNFLNILQLGPYMEREEQLA